MTKPPQSTPHSDIDGVHQDERRNIDTATDAGQDTEDLAEAQKESIARPLHTDDGKSRDDRTG